MEKTLGELWCKVLGLKQVGIYNNCFELGDHSLLATQFMSRLNAALALDLRLRALFDQPIIEDLAPVVTQKLAERAASYEVTALLANLKDESEEP